MLKLGEQFRKISRIIPDKYYLKIKFYIKMKKRLDLKKPKTYNEKLQWLKLYYRDPLYPRLVDKYEVKEYISNVLGEKYVIPCLGVYNSFDEIDFDLLPERFVLKCTHDSGAIVCTNKEAFDYEQARNELEKRMRTNYYWGSREWPYKYVKPRIIAEEFMVDESGYELKDYKFFCFNGDVKALYIATDRGKEGSETRFDFFDENFNHLPFTNAHSNAVVTPKCPQRFDEMKSAAERLSQGMPHVRVDLYNVNGRIYFGEYTFFHMGGNTPFKPEKWDYYFGEWIELPKRNCFDIKDI